MISVLQLGTIDYTTGLKLQQRLVELRKEGRIGDVLLLLEHAPVITLGRNAREKFRAARWQKENFGSCRLRAPIGRGPNSHLR